MSGFPGMNEFEDPYKANRNHINRQNQKKKLHKTNALCLSKHSWAVMIEDNTGSTKFKNKVIIHFN